MRTITIFHNPACETSRNTLALIRNSGDEPDVADYLRTPPDRRTAGPPDAQAPHRRDLHDHARSDAPQGHALRRAGPGRSEVDRLATARLHAAASHPPQPAHRRHAAQHAPVPPFRAGTGHPAQPPARCVHQGRWRAGHRCTGPACRAPLSFARGSAETVEPRRVVDQDRLARPRIRHPVAELVHEVRIAGHLRGGRPSTSA